VSKQPRCPMGNTVKAYDRSPEFFDRVWSGISMEEKLGCFRQALPSGARRVLDAGCGSGRDLRWFLERDLQAVGGDLSAALLDVARQNAPAGRLVRLDLRRLPFVGGSFDGVWACASLLHLPRVQVAFALDELARVLRRGGALFLGMKRGTGESWTDTGGGRRFFTYFEADELLALVEARGFRMTELWRNTEWVDLLSLRL